MVQCDQRLPHSRRHRDICKIAKTFHIHRTASPASETNAYETMPTDPETAPEHLKSDSLSSTAPDSTSTTVLPSSEKTHGHASTSDHKEETRRSWSAPLPKLPETSKFKWGTKEAPELIREVNQAFDVIAKWRKNVFLLPSGSAGKPFTQAKADMYVAYGGSSPMECIALKAAIMALLLLQQPAAKAAHRNSVKHLARRLELGQAGKHQRIAQEGMSNSEPARKLDQITQ